MNEKQTSPKDHADLRQRAMKKAKTVEAKSTETLSSDTSARLVHELEVHQIELELQNEELRESQHELDAVRARYFDLYELAPVGYFSLSDTQMILEVNVTGARLLGMPRNELAHRPFTQFIVREDQDVFYRFRKQICETVSPQACELRMLRADGECFWARLEMSISQDEMSGTNIRRLVVSDISELKRVEQTLKVTVAEKELLLRELQHRCKNNLATIIGLIELQRQVMDGGGPKNVLQELMCRIRAMAGLHEHLSVSEDRSQVDFVTYARTLMADIASAFLTPSDINLSVVAENIRLGLEVASPCGLIMTELVSNAIRYAFPGGRPRPGEDACEIVVSMQSDGVGYTLAVADNGVGLPAEFDWMNATTLGLRLVRQLGQHQLGGQVKLDRTGGTKFVVSFNSKRKG